MSEPSRPPSISGSETIGAALVSTAASIVVAAYLIDRAGGSFGPPLMLALAFAAGAGSLATLRRRTAWRRADLAAFAAIVSATFVWLMWIARPSFLPLGSGPDLTHHILLIQYIERHWRLVHVAGVEDYLGEMVYYTPGSHILTALAGRWAGTTGFHALHAVMSAAAALKAGFVFLVAMRILPRDVPRVPLAAIGALALFASQTYFLGSFTDYSFLAQVVAELFAVAMWWALVAWDEEPSVGLMAFTGLAGAALFLTWPVLIGPPLVVLGALVVLPHRIAFRSRVVQASVAIAPILVVAALFTAGRTGMLAIAGTGGTVVRPSVEAYGWWFLALSTAGIAIAGVKVIADTADLTASAKGYGESAEATRRRKVRTTTANSPRVLAIFAAAIGLQAAALYEVARWNSNEPYMALKMFYLLLYPQAVGLALAIGEAWARLSPETMTVRLKPDTTHRVAKHGVAWTLVALVAFFVVRPLVRAPRSLQVGRHPATSLALEQAGEWVRAHVPIKCVEYLVGDDQTAYWLHLAVLGNARQGPRTGDNATYELTPTLVRWLTPGGLPYAIADLPALPSDVRNDLDIVERFFTAAVVKRRGPSSCDER